MEIPKYEQNLDKLFNEAFDTNHPAMHDWVLVRMELKILRLLKKEGCRETQNSKAVFGTKSLETG